MKFPLSRPGSKFAMTNFDLGKETILCDYTVAESDSPAEEPRLCLTPAVSVHARPEGGLQFGVDARRCGVLLDDNHEMCRELVKVFRQLTAPVPLSQLLQELTGCGLTRVAAQSLIDDMVSYRVLAEVPAEPPEIVIAGASLLSQEVEQLLTAQGIVVHTKMPGQPVGKFLTGTAPGAPLLVVDCFHLIDRLSGWLAQRGGTIIPAGIVDGLGVIGPLRVNDAGPCMACLLLHQQEIDPAWRTLIDEFARKKKVIPPAVLAATAGRLAALASMACEHAFVPPGSEVTGAFAGDMLTINPYTVAPRVTTMTRHRLCPYCFQDRSDGTRRIRRQLALREKAAEEEAKRNNPDGDEHTEAS